MSFPEWAPANLIEEFSRLETEADNCRNRDAEAKSEAFIGDQLSPEDNYWKEQAAKKDDLANILFKLLTHQDMHAV